jgi:hypothetical protein
LESVEIAKLRRVQLKHPPVNSKFWRYHCEGEGRVSSIEALYYAVREYEGASGKPVQGRLEDLLFLFRLQVGGLRAV